MIEELLDMYSTNTYTKIAKYFTKKYKAKFTANSIRKAYERYKYPTLSRREGAPKMLILDIETAPILGHVWSLWKQNVGLNQIQNDWYILSWAAKWYGSDEIMYEDQSKVKNIENDSKLLKNIWKLLDEADIVITQNGKSFDIPKLNARFIMNGMGPTSSFRNIDTLLIAKRHFRFTSNKLEYMTDKLCTKYKKLKHKKFPGHSLWTACMRGDPEAWKEMKEYNVHDILSLEELYEKLIVWDDGINFTVYFDEDVCSCGATDSFKKNGFYFTNASKFQKYKCTECSKEYRGKKNLIKKDLRMTNRKG